MEKSTEVLDHGCVKLVTTWGSDEQIIEAARMSTDKGFQGWGPIHERTCEQHPEFDGFTESFPPNPCNCTPKPGDEKLLKYLYDHKHMTPFEMAGMTIEVQAPIFVFREWHRHRTQSYNELSARYTALPDMNYVPTIERLMMPGGSNKQAVGLDGKTLDEYNAQVWRQELEAAYTEVQRVYQLGLELGVPKEIARLPVAVGRYSRMRASANLRNWLQFLTLRMDPAAQWEIRQYANAVALLIAKHFPRVSALALL